MGLFANLLRELTPTWMMPPPGSGEDESGRPIPDVRDRHGRSGAAMQHAQADWPVQETLAEGDTRGSA